VRNGVAVALVGGVIIALISSLIYALAPASADPGGALLMGLVVGPIFGLAYGLDAAAQHAVLRLLLQRYHLTPLRYVRWLNYTVHLRLLYRGTSGGYVFIHRIVQDHFCDAIGNRP
jgi:hypothetical protein